MLPGAIVFAIFFVVAAARWYVKKNQQSHRARENGEVLLHEVVASSDAEKRKSLGLTATTPMTIRIIEFNSANYDDHPGWSSRLQTIANGIVTLNPDIVCLTEIRLNPDNAGSVKNYQNMAEQILQAVNAKTNAYAGAQLVVTPLMYYPVVGTAAQVEQYVCPAALSPDGQTHYWEGVAILSKYPVSHAGVLYMPKPTNGSDNNWRGTQHAIVELPNGRSLNVFNTHFGLDEPTQLFNASQTVKYMTPYLAQSMPCVLLGDLNVDPTDPCLATLRNASLTDMWGSLHPMDNGYTIPSNAPSERIDYIWVSPSVTPKSIQTIFTAPDANGVYASDHLGLLGTFDV